jgi:hypothetical protein
VVDLGDRARLEQEALPRRRIEVVDQLDRDRPREDGVLRNIYPSRGASAQLTAELVVVELLRKIELVPRSDR